MTWNPRDLPDLSGTTHVVTGGARGIGYFVVEQLAAAGASVIIAARSRDRAEVAIAAVRAVVPHATLHFVPLDLASLASVDEAASAITELGASHGPITGLALNAGLTSPTKGRELTADGLELIVGTNYVGHFALLARTLPALSAQARIVATGSMATRLARADIGDLMQQRGAFSASKAYAYSKHAMQALGFALDRRLRAAHSGMRSFVVHPGFALDVQSPRREGINDLTTGARFSQTLLRPMTQGKNRGAWGTVRALVDPDAEGGTYFGPPGGLRGAPRPQRAVPQDTDPQFAAELWRLSEGWAQLEFQL